MANMLRAAPGTFLAASPDMLDPNFMHSVVLMCQHDDEGAFGLVINQPAPVTVDDLLPEHPLLGKLAFPVFLGGPVGRETLQFVHRVPERISGGVPLAGGLWMGGQLEELAQVIADDADGMTDRVRLLVGYSGWGKGQLDAELALGSWLPAPFVDGEIFERDPELTWRRVIRSIGDGAQGLENLPPDVSWN